MDLCFFFLSFCNWLLSSLQSGVMGMSVWQAEDVNNSATDCTDEQMTHMGEAGPEGFRNSGTCLFFVKARKKWLKKGENNSHPACNPLSADYTWLVMMFNACCLFQGALWVILEHNLRTFWQKASKCNVSHLHRTQFMGWDECDHLCRVPDTDAALAILDTRPQRRCPPEVWTSRLPDCYPPTPTPPPPSAKPFQLR